MSDYEMRWTDVWQPYVEFSREQGSEHLSHQLVTEIVGTALSAQLRSLENFYALVDQFRNLARSAKAQPGNAATLQQLNDLEKELIGQVKKKGTPDKPTVYDKLKNYARGLRESLNSLAAITDYVKVRIRMGKLQNKPGAEETKLLTSMLNEVKSISNDLNQDAQDYINDTARKLATIKAAV